MERSTGKPVTHTVEKMSKSKLNGVSPKVCMFYPSILMTSFCIHAINVERNVNKLLVLLAKLAGLLYFNQLIR